MSRLASINARIAAYEAKLLEAVEFKSAGEGDSNVTNHDVEALERALDRLYSQQARLTNGRLYSRGQVTGIGGGR